MKKLMLNVRGMHCKSCEMLIEDALLDVGAKNISVDHKTGKVGLEFDEKKLSEEKIKQIIVKEGYSIK